MEPKGRTVHSGSRGRICRYHDTRRQNTTVKADHKFHAFRRDQHHAITRDSFLVEGLRHARGKREELRVAEVSNITTVFDKRKRVILRSMNTSVECGFSEIFQTAGYLDVLLRILSCR